MAQDTRDPRLTLHDQEIRVIDVQLHALESLLQLL